MSDFWDGREESAVPLIRKIKMGFKFYTSMLSLASRRMAAGIFIVGMLLTGFGFMIYLLPKLFATLAALFFFFLGACCIVMGIKLLWAQHKFDKLSRDNRGDYRQNVRIRAEDDFEQ
jgi:uncharacterized membrane protein YkvI